MKMAYMITTYRLFLFNFKRCKMNMIKNPILKGFNPDPSICKKDNDYYIATSTFEWFPGVQIHHSKDLVNWKLITRPLNRLSQLNMIGNPDSGGIWAPCLSYSDNKFWLVYTDVKWLLGIWKDTHNYVVTCDTIDGVWSDPVYLNSSGFDPSIFHDDDGRKWSVNMVYDHREDNNKFAGIVLQEYSELEKKLIGQPKMIFKGTKLGLTEGPHIYKYKDYYYLVTAEGGTEYNHAVTVCRAKNIDGPYEVHPQNPIITSSHVPENPLQKAGHASFVQIKDDEWYMVHLVGRPLTERGCCPLGRETAIEKLQWKDGWPYVAGGNSPQLLVEAPGVTEAKWEETAEKDDFNNDELSIDFQTLRIPFDEKLGTLKARNGFLRLYGRETLNSKHTQALVARRWQHFEFDVETSVDFKPYNFQQMAGLVCYYNTMNWVYLNVTWNEELGRVIDLIECENMQFNQPIRKDRVVIPENVEFIYLKTEVRYEKLDFYYSFDKSNWNKVGPTFDANKLSDDRVAGLGFTGAFVGMCCQDLSGLKLHADFDYFTYKRI
jgi:xylan 1,4-beta-xylosidase